MRSRTLMAASIASLLMGVPVAPGEGTAPAGPPPPEPHETTEDLPAADVARIERAKAKRARRAARWAKEMRHPAPAGKDETP